MKKNVTNKGITLIVLVITIIILLILAGISIVTLSNIGLFDKTILAKEKYEVARQEEENILSEYQNQINIATTRLDGSSLVNIPFTWKSSIVKNNEVVDIKKQEHIVVGYIKTTGTALTANAWNDIGTIPSEYAPKNDMLFKGMVGSSNSFLELKIFTTGNSSVRTGSTAFTSNSASWFAVNFTYVI